MGVVHHGCEDTEPETSKICFMQLISRTAAFSDLQNRKKKHWSNCLFKYTSTCKAREVLQPLGNVVYNTVNKTFAKPCIKSFEGFRWRYCSTRLTEVVCFSYNKELFLENLSVQEGKGTILCQHSISSADRLPGGVSRL
jgi:hypothetical protein